MGEREAEEWRYWPGGFEQWRHDWAELERESGPEPCGCEPPPSPPLPDPSVPVDVRVFRSYQPEGSSDVPF